MKASIWGTGYLKLGHAWDSTGLHTGGPSSTLWVWTGQTSKGQAGALHWSPRRCRAHPGTLVPSCGFSSRALPLPPSTCPDGPHECGNSEPSPCCSRTLLPLIRPITDLFVHSEHLNLFLSDSARSFWLLEPRALHSWPQCSPHDLQTWIGPLGHAAFSQTCPFTWPLLGALTSPGEMRPQLPSSSWMPAGAGRQPQRTGQIRALRTGKESSGGSLSPWSLCLGHLWVHNPCCQVPYPVGAGGRVNYKESPRSKSGSDATELGWKSPKDCNVFFFHDSKNNTFLAYIWKTEESKMKKIKIIHNRITQR